MRIYSVCLAACVSVWLANNALAADVAVSPVGFNLSARQDRQAISVINQGSEAVTMQVEQVTWTQVEGEDLFTPTQDLLVNPPLFTIDPNKTQILRVGLRSHPGNAKETAYRLFLREVPATDTSDGTASKQGKVRVLLEMRLPIYVAPTQVIRRQQWHAQYINNHEVMISVNNTGSVHLVIAGLKLYGVDDEKNSKPLAELQASGVVFPGQTKRWHLHSEHEFYAERAVLNVITDKDTYREVLELSRQ